MDSEPLIVAIDGPAGAGKSTIARRVAAKLGALYVDTGAMYRAVALQALRTGIDMESMQALEALAQQAEIRLRTEPPGVWLNGEEVTRAIREPDVAQAASHVAAIPGVRNAMVALQRKYAREASIVMEGRDIGSVVFPNAQVKIYLDADSKVRAARRADEMEAQGQAVDRENLKKEIELRDERDRSRKVSPLLQAPDAEYLDTSKLDPDQVVSAILDIIQRKTAGRKGNAKEAK